MAPRTTERTVTAAIVRAAALIGLAASMAAGRAHAEPHIAMRAGLQCNACHVNHTGGGKRNSFGVKYGLERLPARHLPLPEDVPAVEGVLTSFLSIGADFRQVNVSRFARSGDTNSFETQEGNLYMDVQLLRDRLHLYVDERLAPGGALSREFFALWESRERNLYVKAGRFFPPFGTRVVDDGAFIRSNTGYNFQSPDDGVEVGWEPGGFSTSLAITNGSGGAADDNTNKRVSLLSSWAGRRFRIGGSFSSNRQGEAGVLLAGLMSGLKLGDRLVFLGEIVGGRDEHDTKTDSTRRIIAFTEMDLLVGRGWNLRGAFDYNDADTDENGDEENRITLGAEYTAIQFVQLRFFWRRTDRPPEVHGVTFEDDREIVLELHLFL